MPNGMEADEVKGACYPDHGNVQTGEAKRIYLTVNDFLIKLGRGCADGRVTGGRGDLVCREDVIPAGSAIGIETNDAERVKI
jgi:hypothetical protein